MSSCRKDFHSSKSPEEEAMVQKLLDQQKYNIHSFDAFFNSLMEFPLYGCDADVKDFFDHVDLMKISTLVLWGESDVTIPANPNLSRWLAHATKEGVEVPGNYNSNVSMDASINQSIVVQDKSLCHLRK